MDNYRWIRFIAFRYLTRSRKRRQSSASISSRFAIAGIAIGVFALIMVIGIMNGFQMGFVESILEISSFHLRIETPVDTALPSLQHDAIRSSLLFTEFQALVRGNRKKQQVALIRGVPTTIAEQDPAMIQALHLQNGSFTVTEPSSIIIGAELARSLGLHVGDSISVASIAGDLFSETRPELDTFIVTGIFRSNFYEFDASWAFINLDRALALQDGTGRIQLGIKLVDRWQDQTVIHDVLTQNPSLLGKISSWRDYNRSFFSALRTEKLIMFFLVALIFVVVALNIYQAQRKTVLERREEIGLLRALGASIQAIQTIFITDGFVVGLTGATLGLIPALWFADNIAFFFSILEGFVNLILRLVNSLIGILFHISVQDGGSFTFFSPQVFYIKDIPCKLVPSEVLIIYGFGMLSATLAALWAALPLSKLFPAEVLRYDQ
jgi:lipoprotein-releasing system permease protein